jgi:hypothetical protein
MVTVTVTSAGPQTLRVSYAVMVKYAGFVSYLVTVTVVGAVTQFVRVRVAATLSIEVTV